MKREGQLSPGALAFVCSLLAGCHPGVTGSSLLRLVGGAAAGGVLDVGCSHLLRLDGGAVVGGEPGVVCLLTLDVAAGPRLLRLDGDCTALINNPRLVLVTHHRGDAFDHRNRRRRSLFFRLLSPSFPRAPGSISSL